MDKESSSEPNSSDADDDSAVSVTALSGLSQYSSGADESTGDGVSRPLKRKRKSSMWSSTILSRAGRRLSGEEENVSSTEPSPKKSSGPSFPSWVRNLVQNPDGPSVALAYNETMDSSGKKQMWCVPLRCVYPNQLAPFEVETTKPSTSKINKLYHELPLYFESEEHRSSIEQPKLRSSRSVDDQQLRAIFAKKFRPTQLPSRSRKLATVTKKPAGNIFGSGKIPVEIFDHIGKYISSKDVKNLRLVCKDFEQKVSGSLFHTVVVPFTTEVYGLLSSGTCGTNLHSESNISSNLSAASSVSKQLSGSSSATNQSTSSAYTIANQGVDVFRGFGGHIQRFGMSFEVDQQSLADPPWKALTEGQSTYWGRYIWPFPDYQRFPKTALLENAADETSTMKLAFSYLTNVKHLAISVDSGLGWMSGPDFSIRARVLQQLSPVFDSPRYLPQNDVLGSRKIWSAIEESYASISATEQLKFMELVKDRREDAAEVVRSNELREWTNVSPNVVSEASLEIETIKAATTASKKVKAVLRRIAPVHLPSTRSRQANTSIPPDNVAATGEVGSDQPDANDPVDYGEGSLTRDFLNEVAQNLSKNLEGAASNMHSPQCTSGILYTRPMKTDVETQKPRAHEIWPKQLKRTQKEWLLETAWAQDAFITSYMLAVSDNQLTFSNVTELTISCLSSRYLSKLHRSDFWHALRSLTKVEIVVSADWRDIVKEHNDFLATPALLPSDSVNSFNVLLKEIIAPIFSIKSLTIGWKDGGEHAEGLSARNKKILPAPVVSRPSLLDASINIRDMVEFPHVESLTLKNCWLTPNALCGFVGKHQLRLKQLTLESVSITGHPAVPARHGGVAAGVGAGAAVAGAVAGVLFGAAQNLGAHGPIQPQAPGNAAPAPGTGPALVWHQIMALPFGQAALHAYQAGLPAAVAVTNAIIHHNGLITAHGGSYGPGQGPNPGLGYISPTRLQQYLVQMQNLLAQLNLHQAQLNTNQPAHAQAQPSSQTRRRGCWPEVLEDLKSICLHAGRPNVQFVFLSCGHVKLRTAIFDQSPLEEAYEARNEPCSRTAFFTKRSTALKDHMLTSSDTCLARIVSAIPEHEMTELNTQWGMSYGWPSPELAGPEYNDDDGWGKWGYRTESASVMDGQPRGGTGRFSGKIDGFEIPQYDSD